MNKDLAEDSAGWRALHGVRGRRFCCFICVLVVSFSKSRRRSFCGGWSVRLWRRAQFSMERSRRILAALRFGVCVVGTRKMWWKRQGC